MKSWNAFYDLVLPDLPTCPAEAADVALRMSAIEFCRRAKVWREQQQFVTTAAQSYPLTTDTEKVIHAIEAATCNNTPLRILTAAEAAPLILLSAGTPGGILLSDPSHAKLYPSPSTAGLIVLMELVMRPARTASGVPDDVFEDYSDDIAAKAKALLMMSPRKPYTDVNAAAVNNGAFELAIANAAVRKTAHGRSRPASASRFR